MSLKRAASPWPLAAGLLAVVLSGCGGGDSSPPSSTPTSVTLTGVVADGPLQGAVVCYDLNDNKACDAGEPSASTDANGGFGLSVAAGEAGKHRLLVDVPATAVDKDTGSAVGTAFSMVAPATGSSTQPVFASPLTTLVQAQVDRTGMSVAAAADFIQAQAGLAISPLADFTAASTPDHQKAAHVARLVILTTQQQAAATASVVGQTDLSGATITAADVRDAVTAAAISALPGMAVAVADPSIAGASGAALETALAAAATQIVAQVALTPADVAAAVGLAKLPPETAVPAPAPAGSLTAFRFTSADDWFTRMLESSTADNTPDAANKVRYYSVYRQSQPSGFSSSGVVYAWGAGNALARAGDMHWDGSDWVACPLGTRSEATVRDAAGNSTYEYCLNAEQGVTSRRSVDLSGQSIATVFQDTIRTFPGSANGVAYSDWGPADLSMFGTASFPAGSKLYYQTNTVTASAPAYDVQAANAALAFTADVAAGGDARSGSPACAQVTGANSATFQSPVTSLEDLVARNPGQPCVFNAGTNADGTSLNPNEWWSNSTTSIGTIAGSQTQPAGTGNYYTTTGYLRVGFAATGNGVTYYHCLQRHIDGSVRNCTALGTGSYTIATLGDARVLSFSAQPALAQRLGYVRVFVERGGKVYYGYESQLGSSNYLRLNLEAANAVFAPLGLPPVRPVTRASDFSAATATALATAKGAWGGATATEAIVLRVGDNGRFLLGEALAADPVGREQSGAELGYLDIDTTTGMSASLLEVDSDLTGGTSHPSPGETLTISSTAIVSSTGTTLARLPDSGTGIVGLWAIGSATDLSVVHIAFFGNGKVLLIDNQGETSGACAQARQGPPGAEFASYTFAPSSGALHVFGKIYDTNGCAGFFDSSAGAVAGGTANSTADFVVVIAADGKTAVATAAGEAPFTLYRIAPQ